MRKFHEGNILSHLIYLSWPMLLGNFLQNIQSVYEIYLLGKLGVSDIAVIGIAGTIILFFWSITGGVLNGVVALSSRLLSQDRIKELNSYLFQILIISFFSGLLFSITVFIFQDFIFGFFGAQNETLIKTKRYYGIAIFYLLNFSIFFVFVGFLRSIGNSLMILYLTIINVFVYILLAPVFILGKFNIPSLGIKGAALAGLFGILITNGIVIIYFIKKKFLIISKKHLKIQPDVMKKFLKLSLPAMAQGILTNISYFALLKIVSLFGEHFIAANSIGLRLNGFVMMLGWPIGVSGGVIVGHNLGKKLHERANLTVLTGIKVYSIITFTLTLVFIFFPEFVIKMFTSDLKVMEYGINFLKIVAPVYVIMGIALIIHSAFNGAGATQIPTNINFISFFLVQLPIAYFLARYTPSRENGIFIAISISFLIQGIISFFAYKDGKWLKREI